MTAAPKYATVADPSAPNDGARIARIAALLGKPLMPWQRQVAEVATEREPDGSYRYELVMVTVPRQSGKTTLLTAVLLERIMRMAGARIFYTAQTGKDAGQRFKEMIELVQQSPLDEALHPHYRYSAGDMAIEMANRSSARTFAPVASALHGEHPPFVGLDEIWAYDELLGDAIYEGAIVPAQLTLRGVRQVWFVSTAGTAESTFMKKWRDRGRKGRARMAYFEWAIADGDDPYDVDAIARFHPAVGFTTTAQDIVDIGTGAGAGEDEGMSRAEYLRALCNSWTEALDPIIGAEEWRALARTMLVPSKRDVAITYDVAPDNDAGRIMATWRDLDGDPCTRVVHAAPGTRWMLDALVTIYREWRPAVLGADDGGPTRRLTDELRRKLGDDAVTTTGGKDFGTACESLVTAILDDGTLNHDGSKVLEREVAAVVLDPLNGVRRISRTRSPACVAGLIAAAVGLWLYDHHEDDHEAVVGGLEKEPVPW